MLKGLTDEVDLPADFFDSCFAEPHLILRMSRYAVIDREDGTVASLVPHTDSGFMTLLPPNLVPGLSILLPSGRWVDAPGVEGAYVVNGNDILHRWTNERFLSTPHRVRNVSGQVRYAIPFFCDPDHDTIIECLPTCPSAENPAKYPPIRFGGDSAPGKRRQSGECRLSSAARAAKLRRQARRAPRCNSPAEETIMAMQLGHVPTRRRGVLARRDVLMCPKS
jgi:2-oxoglutarate-Fe(II)-dependent oxygenase superfamily protein